MPSRNRAKMRANDGGACLESLEFLHHCHCHLDHLQGRVDFDGEARFELAAADPLVVGPRFAVAAFAGSPRRCRRRTAGDVPLYACLGSLLPLCMAGGGPGGPRAWRLRPVLGALLVAHAYA